MKTIFHYNNYRQFLEDYYTVKKKSTGFFTYRYFAQIAGFSSPVFIKLVIDGKSNLRIKSIDKLSLAMNLNAIERSYFSALVNFNQAKTRQKKKEFLTILRSLNKKYCAQILDSNQYDYYTKWYHSVLRELAPHARFKKDYKTLGSMVTPSLKKMETKKAMELLLNNGLLEEQEDGSYNQSQRLISTGTEFESLAVRELHEQMALRATEAIDSIPKDERDISGLTMGISSKGFQLLQQELKEFREKIMKIVAQDAPVERVYRLNLQLFPLSSNIESGSQEEK